MAYNLIDGNDEDNYLFGDIDPLNFSDKIRGFEGDDILTGGKGRNYLIGGTGNDELSQRETKGNNLLRGGEGDDYLNIAYSQGNNLLYGGTGNDQLDGTGATGNNTFYGRSGDDSIRGSQGNDVIYGGGGNDSIFTSYGNDFVDAGYGNDQISFSSNDNLFAPVETFTIDGGAGRDILGNSGFSVNSVTMSFSNPEQTSGTIVTGNNTVNFTSIERFFLSGSHGDDVLLGSRGDDILSGFDGSDFIDSGAGKDRIYISGFGNHQVLAGEGNDFIEIANSGNYTIDGGAGKDILGATVIPFSLNSVTISFSNNEQTAGTIASGGNTINFTSIESFYVQGSDTDDLLLGGTGKDSIDAIGGGSDIIDGGAGNDDIYLSFGSDTTADSIFYNLGDGKDRIVGFVPENDSISFTDVPHLDLVQNLGRTEIRLGDGIADNAGFGTGEILMILTRFTATDLTAANLVNADFFFS
jgi:Ca2+-binding RTX toxin-like protein